MSPSDALLGLLFLILLLALAAPYWTALRRLFLSVCGLVAVFGFIGALVFKVIP